MAQQTPVPTANYNGDVQEKDFPCAIVLCLANPKGPMAESKCVPPVKWLISNFIEKLKPWPSCNFGDGGNTSASYQTLTHIDCPTGFTAEQATTDSGYSGLTGVCLRAVPTCATTGANAYTPSIAGAACYAVQVDNGNDHYDQITTTYLEAYIPSAGITNYAMNLTSANGYAQTFYFNLGGGAMANLAASIIYRVNNNNAAFNSSGGNGG
jgi:hypothetical protein